MIWLYRLLFLPALLLACPYYLIRMWRRGGYAKSFEQRFGRFHKMAPPTAGKRRIWLQAVSVGEVLAVGPLIEALQKDGRVEIVLTTTTSTGYAEARKRYASQVEKIGIFPLDFFLFNRIAWKRIQPDALILTESELWPEHLHRARKQKTPAFLVNARISDRSFSRYRKVSALAGRMLRKFRRVYAASPLDRSRLLDLGCPEERIASFGSIKFDVSIEAAESPVDLEELRASLGFETPSAFVLLGSSTWPGEEAALLQTQEALIAAGVDCRLLLVPRHAERAPDILALLKAQSLSWHQRSISESPASGLRIHLADTTGELSRLTQAADLAFIGKSLDPNYGGQTPIEAAGFGIPILMGPHMNNFRDISGSLIQAGAAKTVLNGEALTLQALRLAKAAPLRQKMRESGIHWHQSNRGSSGRIAEDILRNLHNP